MAVGGTTLSVDASGNYLGETAWSGSGGSLSTIASQPGYQQNLIIHSGNAVISANGRRAGPDVAMDADPNTGVAVYSSYGWNGWAQVGGTSAAAPQWAGLVAIADQGRALAGLGSLDGATQTLPALYQLSSSDFHDVTTGSNGGYQAGPGYDLVTGRGSPVANLVIRDLVAGTNSGSTQPPSIATAAHVVSQSPTTASLSVLGQDSAGESTLVYTWKAIGTVPGSVSFTANGNNAAKNTIVVFGAAGTYTLQVTGTDAGGLSVTSQVVVTINQVLTSLSVTPGSMTLAPGATQQFSALATDQFGNALTTQPRVAWSLPAGSAGSIATGSGLFTAGTATGTAIVQASAGGMTASVTVTVASSAVVFKDNLESGASNWSVTSGAGDYYLVNVNGNHRLLDFNNGSQVDRVVAGQSKLVQLQLSGHAEHRRHLHRQARPCWACGCRTTRTCISSATTWPCTNG